MVSIPSALIAHQTYQRNISIRFTVNACMFAVWDVLGLQFSIASFRCLGSWYFDERDNLRLFLVDQSNFAQFGRLSLKTFNTSCIIQLTRADQHGDHDEEGGFTCRYSTIYAAAYLSLWICYDPDVQPAT